MRAIAGMARSYKGTLEQKACRADNAQRYPP